MGFKIVVAEDPSFCPGVRRAFRLTIDTLVKRKERPVFSIGPLIHNPGVVSMLKELGLVTVDADKISEFDMKNTHAIIRSHGIDWKTEDELLEKGALVVDATCPTVKRVQEEARDLFNRGFDVVIVGSPTHPEVQSIVGRIPGRVHVLDNVEEARAWLDSLEILPERVGIVCQTTRGKQILDDITDVIRERINDVAVIDTNCNAVSAKREEAYELAGSVDVMIVVGGKNSSNTSHLVSICSSTGVTTYWIEDVSEIMPEWFDTAESVGVIGGASTPDWVIDEVVGSLKSISG